MTFGIFIWMAVCLSIIAMAVVINRSDLLVAASLSLVLCCWLIGGRIVER